MGRERFKPGLASVTKIATKRRPGRPYKTLTSAVVRSADQRDVLLLLRQRIASQLDGSDVKATAFGALIRQFREVDAEIRMLDAAEACAAEDEADGPDDDDDSFNPDDI